MAIIFRLTDEILNSIPTDQNAERQLDRLAAQRYLYSKAKILRAIQMALTLPPPLMWAILVVYWPDLKVWAALYGISASIFDAAVLDYFQKSFKEQAAKIQERFDCDVLHLEWRSFKVSSSPDPETIQEASQKYKKRDFDYSDLKNWYPPSVGKLPLYLARLVCQRTNCWWDSKLRRRYEIGMVSCIVILTLLVFVIGLQNEMSLEKFVLAIVAPLSPAFLWGIREYRKQHETIEALNRFKNHAESLWAKAIENSLSIEAVERESRDLQDAIYDHRRNNTPIFNWIYKRLRRRQEEQMNKGAEELVEEILQKLS